MDVDIDHLGEFWSNGCGYVPFSEQCIWKNGYTPVVVRMAGYTAGIGHVYILLIGPKTLENTCLREYQLGITKISYQNARTRHIANAELTAASLIPGSEWAAP